MELIDVPGGSPKLKSEVHRDGDWHVAAHVWLVDAQRRVVLQKRAAVKENWPGKWDVSVAGHVSAGETAIEAAIREAREELGLALAADELTHIGTLREQCVLNDGAYIDNEIHEVFIARREVDVKNLTLDPQEVEEVRLVPIDDIDAFDLVPHPAEYALLRSVV